VVNHYHVRKHFVHMLLRSALLSLLLRRQCRTQDDHARQQQPHPFSHPSAPYMPMPGSSPRLSRLPRAHLKSPSPVLPPKGTPRFDTKQPASSPLSPLSHQSSENRSLNRRRGAAGFVLRDACFPHRAITPVDPLTPARDSTSTH
jgi:hypothetical protein